MYLNIFPLIGCLVTCIANPTLTERPCYRLPHDGEPGVLTFIAGAEDWSSRYATATLGPGIDKPILIPWDKHAHQPEVQCDAGVQRFFVSPWPNPWEVWPETGLPPR